MWYYVAFLLLCILEDAVGVNEILDPPANTAQLEGQPVQLNCTVDSLKDEALEWYEYVSSSSAKRIYSSALPNKIDSNLYEIRGTYNLFLKKVSLRSAGRYECRLYVKEEVHPAQLTVLSKLSCDPDYKRYPPQEGVEGQTIRLACSATYNTSDPTKTQPVMQWRRQEDPIKTSNQSLEGRAVYVSSLNATAADDDVPFTCELVLQQAEGVVGRLPPYKDTCRSRFLVKHSPRNIRLYPDPSDWPDGTYMQLYVGDAINCTASSRPPARYFWKKLAGQAKDSIVMGDTLHILPAHAAGLNKYACVAQSQDSLVEATREVEFTAVNIGAKTNADGQLRPSTDVNFLLSLTCLLYLINRKVS